MANRNRWQITEDFNIPHTPLLDVIFILIIFFLVSTTFYSKERDMKVELPKGNQGESVSRDKNLCVVNVRKGGTIVVNDSILTRDELEKRLISAKKSGHRVEIRGDRKATHGKVMQVMNLCKKNGINNYSLTQRVVRETE